MWGDQRLRAELEALLARATILSGLGGQDRQRISGVFHAAFALPPVDRRVFLERACAGRPDDRREVGSQRTRARYRRAARFAGWTFSAIFALEAALMLYADRPGTAAPLLILAAVNVLVFLVIEPAAEDDAFPDDLTRPRGQGQGGP